MVARWITGLAVRAIRFAGWLVAQRALDGFPMWLHVFGNLALHVLIVGSVLLAMYFVTLL